MAVNQALTASTRDGPGRGILAREGKSISRIGVSSGENKSLSSHNRRGPRDQSAPSLAGPWVTLRQGLGVGLGSRQPRHSAVALFIQRSLGGGKNTLVAEPLLDLHLCHHGHFERGFIEQALGWLGKETD